MVRNLFKYSKYYPGQKSEFIEGDIFKIIVPLDEKYSFDAGVKNDDKKAAIKSGNKKVTKKTQMQHDKIIDFIKKGKKYNIQDFCELLGLKESRTRDICEGNHAEKKLTAKLYDSKEDI